MSREGAAFLGSPALERARVGRWCGKKARMLLGGGENQSSSPCQQNSPPLTPQPGSLMAPLTALDLVLSSPRPEAKLWH